MTRRIVPAAILATATAGCTYRTVITSEPPRAIITIDGDRVGEAPVEYEFDFGRKKVYHLQADEIGYFPLQRTVTSTTPGLKAGTLDMVLQEDLAWSSTTTSDAANRWLRVQIKPGISKTQMWQRLVAAVTNNYDNLEQLDPLSGYTRSVVVSQRFKHAYLEDYEIRTQFLGALDSEDPLTYKLKIVAEQCTRNGGCTPYDRIFKSDAQLVEEIQQRLGVIPVK